MTKNPLISVIVPVYNTERFLKECLDSVIYQTYKNLEIIIVNDGSKDSSLSIINEYAQKDNRIKVISRENRGVSASRNDGLDIASGEYLCFIDSDDYMALDTLEILLRGIEESGADIASSGTVRVSEKDRSHFLRVKRGKIAYKVYDKVSAMREVFTNRKIGLGPWKKLYKRALFESGEKIRFDENIYYCEDIPVIFDVFNRADKTVYTPAVCYAYTRRNGSSVRSKLSKKKTTSLIAVKYCTDQCEKLLPEALPHVYGWRVLANFEMLFYMWRDSYYDYRLFNEISTVLKTKMKNLTKSRGFELYRRALLPFASFLAINFYKIKFAKRLKADKKNK